MSKFVLIVIAASSTAFLASGGHSLLPLERMKAQVEPACDIKGNVSINTGERI